MKKNGVKKKHSKMKIKESISMGLLALPGIILLFIFCYIPMFGIVIAFKDYKPMKGILGSAWVGFGNFEYFFTSQDAFRTIRNTMCYNIAWMILGTICSVGLALMYYSLKNAKALKVYNTVILIPRFLSAVILSFLVEIFLHPRCGLLNQWIGADSSAAIDWYTKPEYWPFILTVVYIWGSVGMQSVIYYAALVSLDTGLIEAAQLDGANKVQQIWHVMIPHLIPIIIIQNILAIGQLFQGDFGLFYQVPKNSGMLYPTTDVINTYTFRALASGYLGKSAAVGLAQSVAGLVTVVATNAIVKKISPENSLF